jgi:general secretion pathway protein D
MGLLNIKPMTRREPEVLALGFALSCGDALTGRSRLGNRLRKAVSCVGAVSLLAFGGIAFNSAMLPAHAQSAEASDNDVELDVTNANILSVVELLRKPGGTQFIISGDTKLFRPVTVHVSGPLPKVLKYVSDSAGASITKDEFGVYTISPEGAVKATVVSANTTAESNGDALATQKSAEPEHIEKIAVTYVDPAFIMSVLQVPQRHIDSPYKSDLQIYGHGLFDVDSSMKGIPSIVRTSEYSNAVANTSSFGDPSNSVSGVPGMSGTAGDAAANRATSTVGLPSEQFTGMGGMGGLGGMDQGAGLTGGQGGLGGGPNGQNGRANIRPDGISSIIGIAEQNMLLVKGTAEAIGELRAIVQMLDVPAKQVQVKVEMVTATENDIDQFGINYDLIPIPGLEASFQPVGNSDSTNVQGSTTLSYTYGNLSAKLQALLSSSRGRDDDAETITLTNNVAGSIMTVTEVPYTTSNTVTSNSSTNTNTTTNYVAVATGITVLAKVNGDNTVTIRVVPQISSIDAYSSTNAPTVVSQNVITVQTVGNGETFVMGGITTKTDNNARYEIPILGEIPIIGSIFRSRDASHAEKEQLWFVTPTVLPLPGKTTTGEEVNPEVNGVASVGVGAVTP